MNWAMVVEMVCKVTPAHIRTAPANKVLLRPSLSLEYGANGRARRTPETQRVSAIYIPNETRDLPIFWAAIIRPEHFRSEKFLSGD